jgi:hypothetical protein
MVTREGEQYLHVQDLKWALGAGTSRFQFNNLFGGDKALGKYVTVSVLLATAFTAMIVWRYGAEGYINKRIVSDINAVTLATIQSSASALTSSQAGGHLTLALTTAVSRLPRNSRWYLYSPRTDRTEHLFQHLLPLLPVVRPLPNKGCFSESTILALRKYAALLIMVKVKLSLCLTNYALRHEDVWEWMCRSTFS